MNNNAYPSASLYVGDLHSDVTETMLFEIFKAIGPIASLRVCRDAVTRRSLGYAYINFHNPVDAERALDTMNYTAIKGRPVRIMWSHRDPSLRKSGLGNIFIKNLDKSIDHKALYDTFSVFGNILSCKVALDEGGNSKGYGFVHYETQEAADLAVQKSNGKLLNGKIVYVGPFVARKERSRGGIDGDDKKYTNIYVKNLDVTITSEKLKTLFEKFGPISSCVVMTDDAGKSKGFGFINFETPDAARKSVEEMNNQPVEGKQLFVGRAQKKAEREAELRSKFEQLKQERLTKTAGVNLFIKNLDDAIDDEKLKVEFAQYGTITSAKIMRDEKGTSKGFGFVCFTTPEEATKALTEMNGRMFGQKPIYVGLAQRKEVRRASLESSHRPQGFPRVGPYPGGMYPPLGTFYPPQGPIPGRGGFIPGYPQGIVPRARGWAPPGGIPGRGAPGPYPPNYPGMMPGMPPRGGARGGPRGGRGGMPGPMGGLPPGVPPQGLPQGLPPGQGPVPTAGVPPNAAAAAARPPAGASQPVPGAADAQRGFKWTKEARNREAATDAQPTDGPATAAGTSLPTPEERRQQLGETLYPLIEAIETKHAGKITGMLLESLGVPELLELLDSPMALNAKVAEALGVLQAHEKTQQPAQ